MKRRTLDIILAVGGIAIAAILAVVGLFLAGQHAFATEYVKGELGAQKITFATADKLTDAEKNWKPGSTCLVKFAGQTMTEGVQAECYAKYYLAEHMDASAKNAGFPGATYATLGAIRTGLTAEVTAAKAKGDTAAAADAQKKFDAATALRSSLQTGETLRGLLLTVYGFNVIGDMADLGANAMFALAAVMAILGAAGLIHAFVTPKDKVVFAPQPQSGRTTVTA